ncbi:MAG: GntR family transcriptional regulator [Spirochaetes bacterium]|nr:GntR family transcriptional regulator [Spirochaetota bacterium]
MQINDTKYNEVKIRLTEKIKKMKAGERLPGERELARIFGFSYMTIRRAVEDLVEDKSLYRIPRKGTFVSNPRNNDVTTGNIGFYLYEKLKHGISSPYYSLVFKAIQKEFSAHGYNLIFFTDPKSVNLDNLDGVVATAFSVMRQELLELSSKKPVIMTDNDVVGLDIPAVVVDNYNSTYTAIEYAISTGHKIIGYIHGILDYSVGVKRLAGYTTALDNYGIARDDSLLYQGDYEYSSGYEASGYFLSLQNRPTFIHCANDLMAMGLIKGFIEAGIRVPEDISVSGFDNIGPASTFHPSITTMAVDFDRIARETVKLMIAEIKNENVNFKKLIIPASLIIRESSAVLEVPDNGIGVRSDAESIMKSIQNVSDFNDKENRNINDTSVLK